MKTLKESLLGDLEDNLKSADEYVDAIKEVNKAIKNISVNKLEYEPTGEWTLTLNIPKWLKYINTEYTHIKISVTIYEAAYDLYGGSIFMGEISTRLCSNKLEKYESLFSKDDMRMNDKLFKSIDDLKKQFIKMVKNIFSSKNIVELENTIRNFRK